jgi:DNA-binding MarR family transcriptional regulator
MTARPAELVRRTNQALAAIYSTAHPKGLTIPQFAVLDVLRTEGPKFLWQLVEATGIDRSSMSEMVKRLAREGLVKIERDERDARRMRATITIMGRKAARKAETPLWNAEVDLMAKLTPQERGFFIKAMGIIAGGVRRL